MVEHEKINILLVDDHPAKLVSYEIILSELNENLIKAASAREAFEHLLKSEIAIVLVDVCMPELDGFELAAMIREHPRFQKTAIIFVSAIHMADDDRLRGYRMGAVDYMPVPVVPEILRAKVKVFAELYRKTRQLEQLNSELERRVAERTAELESSNWRLTESEGRRSIALAAGKMGSWDWDLEANTFHWDDEHCRIVGIDRASFRISAETVRPLVHPEDWKKLEECLRQARQGRQSFQLEIRFARADDDHRWCAVTAAAGFDGAGKLVRMSGVTSDITERKLAEERHALLAREVDHRAKNALAVVQSVVRLTRAESIPEYIVAVEGRIKALSHAHTLLSESRWQGADLKSLVSDELEPYLPGCELVSIQGPAITLEPAKAQSVALIIHELATNAAKYGALSQKTGKLHVAWTRTADAIELSWNESGGPSIEIPKKSGFGFSVIAATLRGQLRGEFHFDWRSEGLHCRLSIPTRSGREKGDATPRPAVVAPRREVAKSRSVLVVEDEPLLGMMMSDALTQIGFVILGPYGRLSEAVEAAKTLSFTVAVLDVSLGGETVYEVADLLTRSGVPYLFVTGYGKESLEPRFAHIRVLRKPVDVESLRIALEEATSQQAAAVA